MGASSVDSGWRWCAAALVTGLDIDLEYPLEALRPRYTLPFQKRNQPQFSLLVPSNEVSAYRITRALQRSQGIESWALWFYPHLGRGSKTSRMADFLPYGLEGTYSYQEILNATIWVTTREFPMPGSFADRLANLLRADVIESILVAVREDPEIARIVLSEIRRRIGRRLTATNEDAIEEALGRILTVDPRMAPDFSKSWRWQQPIVEDRFSVPEDAVEHGLR